MTTVRSAIYLLSAARPICATSISRVRRFWWDRCGIYLVWVLVTIVSAFLLLRSVCYPGQGRSQIESFVLLPGALQCWMFSAIPPTDLDRYPYWFSGSFVVLLEWQVFFLLLFCSPIRPSTSCPTFLPQLSNFGGPPLGRFSPSRKLPPPMHGCITNCGHGSPRELYDLLWISDLRHVLQISALLCKCYTFFYVPPARKLVFSLQLRVAQWCVLRCRGMKCKNWTAHAPIAIQRSTIFFFSFFFFFVQR